MLQWKVLGIGMIIPTLLVAIIITIKTRIDKDNEFWVNLAICFWISANSYWMICEFAGHEEIKDYAGVPFVAGMLSVLYFYIKRMGANKNITD